MLRLVKILLFIIILLLGGLILYGSLKFLSPDFSRGYLIGKEELFNSFIFPTGLYVHMFATPICLFLSAILVLFRLERKSPRIHRILGKITLIGILFLVVPTGLILSTAAIGGTWGVALFLIISLFTGFSFSCGWKFAINKNFTLHKRWMIRGFLLLNGALFLRLSIFFTSYFLYINSVNSYLYCVLFSWFFPLMVFEVVMLLKRK